MNLNGFILFLVVFTLLFTALVLLSLLKNPVAWIDDYPPDIKAAYFAHIGQEEKKHKLRAGTIIRKVIASVVFLLIFVMILVRLGADSFWDGFVLSLVAWVWIGIYDTLCLDFLIFANWKAVRLPGTEEMDEAYHQKKFHVTAAVKRGLPLALVIALLAGIMIFAATGETTDADVVTTVAGDGFEGHLYVAGGEKVVITFSGSEGGSSASDAMAWYYREHGISAMGVSLFGTNQTGNNLDRVPLEYVENAIAWLKAQGYTKIAVDGISKGSEYALLVATMFDDISCVVARVPSYFISEGMLGKKGPSGTSCWSYKGKEIPYTPYKIRKFNVMEQVLSNGEFNILEYNTGKNVTDESIIPVEKIKGPVLLISTEADTIWPSREQADMIEERFSEKGFSYEYKNLHYKYVSHFAIPMRKNEWLMKLLFKTERQNSESCSKERKALNNEAVSFVKDSL